VGKDNKMLKYEGPRTKVVDLKGRTVPPPLMIDGHAHMDREGVALPVSIACRR
jgi:predicted amidohydrolase YtcJ